MNLYMDTLTTTEEKEVAKTLDPKRFAAYERAMAGSDSMSVHKITLIIPEGTSRVLPAFPARPGVTALDIILKPDSRLSFSYMQNGAEMEHHMFIVRFVLERSARLETNIAMFGGGSSSLSVETLLDGAESSLKEQTVFFGGEQQVFEMFSNTVMRGKSTRALVESKGILDGGAKCRFDGSIHIEQSAQQANAKLIEHTLLLSPEAVINAIPGLTIDTNDVIATHSASMTRIDDEQLFYCKSRGIEESEAVRMIGKGFLKNTYAAHPKAEKIEKIIYKKLCRM